MKGIGASVGDNRSAVQAAELEIPAETVKLAKKADMLIISDTLESLKQIKIQPVKRPHKSNKIRINKKLSCVFMAVLLALSLYGCSKNNNNPDNGNGSDISSQPTDSAIDASSQDNSQNSDETSSNDNTNKQDNINANQNADNNIAASGYILNISTNEKGVDISDTLYGLFYEDINFAADGGLYAEMIINRSFEYEDGRASNGHLHGYKAYNNAELSIQSESPLNENNPHYIRIINVAGEAAGIINTGFLDGMNVTSGSDYRFTIYLRSDTYKGGINVCLQDKNGEIAAEASLSPISSEWAKYEIKLTASADINPARLLLTLTDNGYIEADMISLFPYDTYKNRENGLRADLASMLAELNPSFIRFPGGCIVEGGKLSEAYNWKDTVGDIAERKQNINIWHGSQTYPYYQSYGLGFYEYFLLCEDLGAAAVPILNCGMACQARSQEMAAMDVLDQYIQDALDLIEFANGGVDTEWGALRAAMGHPEPFNMEYLGIGNEQWHSAYFARYDEFQKVISEKYPEIKLITSAGPTSNGDLYEYAWNRISLHDKDEVPYAELADEHYYNAPEWFLKNVYRYDEYSRESVGVFLGEYAAKSNTLYAAIAEAAYMTGLERNSDVVRMAAYAPLFGSLVSSQWSPDLIWFNNNSVFGSVNYYVQKMFANNAGDYTLKSELTGNADISAIKGKVGIGTWLTSASFDDIKVVDNKTGAVLYETNFDSRGAGWLASTQGEWKVMDDNGNSVFTQLNASFPTDESIMGSSIYNGDVNWTDYTLTLKAKKISGREGFLISFAVNDFNNFYFWNIGGWNNTLSVVEQAQGGTKTSACTTVPMNIRTNEWYDIKIVVTSESAECYLNDKLIHTINAKAVPPVYETVSKDEETGDIIIKLVNSLGTEETIQINLGEGYTKRQASVQLLSGSNKMAQNSLAFKETLIPVDGVIEADASFEYTAPAYSLSIIRIPKK